MKRKQYVAINVTADTKLKAKAIANALGKYQAEVINELIEKRYRMIFKTKKILEK